MEGYVTDTIWSGLELHRRLANNRLVGGIPWSISALPKLRELSVTSSSMMSYIFWYMNSFDFVSLYHEPW
jgi:hypothetical protein